MRRRNNTKNTLTYKEIRKLFRHNFIPPNFTDFIIDGVSFKWYYNSEVRRLLNGKTMSEYFRQFCPIDIYRIMKFKTLPRTRFRPEHLRYGREEYEPVSLRILVKLRGLE